uniref:Uncharacterized protein n=1 Tax=Gibberella zeae TaxID=5518 RepID=A0A4E9EF08_GIBZA
MDTVNQATDNPATDNLEATHSHPGLSYPVDFIMNIELQTSNGTDIPLYNKTLEIEKLPPWMPDYAKKQYPSITRNEGEREDVFDSDNEDYWLFYVHLHNAELEIAIGGEEPIYATSRPNWNKISGNDKSVQDVHGQDGTLYQLRWQYGDSYDRFVAVRAPKMDNPAISLRTHGQFGAVHWVGLFTKTGVSNTNHFIAVRTSNRLLPHYAERTKKYPGYRNWYLEDGPANILDCALTLFPKQLYGTTTNSPDLYSQFVTQDPFNKVGIKHFEHAIAKTKGQPPWPKRYQWAAEGTTYIRISKFFLPFSNDKWFDYVSGVMLKDTVTNKGWAVLLEVFGSTVAILKGVLSVNVAEVVGGVLSLGDAFDEKKMHEEANVRGFLTSIAQAVDVGNQARKDGKKKKPAEKPNVTNILVLVQQIDSGKYSHRDLGSRPREIE